MYGGKYAFRHVKYAGETYAYPRFVTVRTVPDSGAIAILFSGCPCVRDYKLRDCEHEIL